MRRADRILSLVAAPTFAAMSLLCAIGRADMLTTLCSGMPAGLHISSMSIMYALMGAFHLGPWLRADRPRIRREKSAQARMRS
jgi:hypothetical protein